MHAPAAQPEQLAAAKPGADLGDEMVAVERPAGGKEPTELLRRQGAAALMAENLVWIDARLWRLHVPHRVGGDQLLLAGGLHDPQQDGAAGHHAAVAELAFQVVLPAQHDRGGDLAELPPAERRAREGPRWGRR